MKANNPSFDPAAGPAHTANRRKRLSPMKGFPIVSSATPTASASHDLPPAQLQQNGMMSSSCGDGEGRASDKACPSPFSCGGCVDVLHELSNVMTGVLTNAQVLGWKLPPYSHLKRSVREVERNAQRGGELLKRLMSCAEKLREVQP